MLTPTIKKALNICISMNIPFYVYALPNQKCVFFANPSCTEEAKARFDGQPEFILNYFNNEYPYVIGLQPEMTATQIVKNLSKLKFHNDPEISPWPCETQFMQYKSQVHQIVQSLKRNGGKTVLSKVYSAKTEIDWVEVINYYFKANKNCFRNAFYTRETGCWLGATPEVLLETSHADNSFKTMSLAGTRRIAQSNIEWDIKNIHEHNFVTQYIVNTLCNLGIEANVGTAENVKFGIVEHLCHRITGNLNLENIKDVISKLSPTPAVAGYPLDKALADISQYEVHPRYCYAGNVGFCDEIGYHIFVNLRCVHFNKEAFCIYAGGGLTAMSDAQDEWDEASNKMLPLLESISKSIL